MNQENAHQRMGMRLNRLSNHLRTAMDQHFLRNEGLTAQQTRSMLFLHRMTQEADREINQRDLEQFLGLKSPTVTGVLKRLEDSGMIERTVSQKDGRVKILRLTERGTKVIGELRRDFDYFEHMLLDGFSQEEIDQLSGYMDRLKENVRRIREKSPENE